MLFASPLPPILSKFAPVRRRTPLRPGPVQARYRWLSSVGHTQELPGSWAIHPLIFAPLCDPGRLIGPHLFGPTMLSPGKTG
jgi:hypothetical protein